MRALWSKVILGVQLITLFLSWILSREKQNCQCVHHACVYWICVLLLVRDSEIPTHPYDWRQHICLWNNQQFINSFASLNMYTSTNFHVCWGFLFEQVFVFYWILQGCRYCQWILFKQLVSSTIVWKSVKCWNIQPSCSSHHVECTKTWMRDVSSVLWGDRMLFFEVRQPTHTCPAKHPKQEQSNGSWW